jgi:GNAT superfamily N-acetyltransferase
MQWEIRKAETKDIPQMMSLFSSQIAAQKSEGFFHWWNAIPSITYCAIRDEELIGMFVVLKRKLTNDLHCGVLMGLLVKTEWRGTGLFKELGEAAMAHFDDIDFYCCLTNALGKKALEKNFAFRAVGTIETMCLAKSAHIADTAREYPCAPVTGDTAFDAAEGIRRDPLMFLADARFRRWRFADHPFNAYCIMRQESGVFAVVNPFYDKSRQVTYADIVDYELRSFDEENVQDVLTRVSASLGNHANVVTIQAVPHSMLHRVVKKIGFEESSAQHCFCVKIKEPKNEYLYNASDWLIKWGDYLR